MEETNIEIIELVVDTQDRYLNQENVFYIHPQRLAQVRFLENNKFSSCLIVNTRIEFLNSLNMKHLLRKLVPEAELEIQICQPISVMQELDAKQFEAIATHAGFRKIKIVEDKKSNTYTVHCVRPEIEENVVEVVVEKRGSIKQITQDTLKTIQRTSTKDSSKKYF